MRPRKRLSLMAGRSHAERLASAPHKPLAGFWRTVTAATRRTALEQLVSVLVFGLLPTLTLISLLREPGLGWDFRAFYLGAHAYLSGLSPYPGHSLAALAYKQEFVYPAPIAALFAPFALLPYTLALTVWCAMSVAAIALALWLLGVRDWRCLGALFLTQPVEQSVRLGTLMPILTLLLALLWKYRDRLWTAAALAAIVAVSKLFLFPLFVWLVVTRRVKTAAVGAAVAAGLCALGWLPIVSTLASYPSLLRALAGYEETFSYSLTSLTVGLGVSAANAATLAIAAGAGLLLWAAAARKNDFFAFRLALAASFVMSPIVWGHYYVLLIVPLALRRPRLSALWLAAIWIKPDTLQLRNGTAWVALALVVLGAQLDLALPVGRWWNRLPRARMRQIAAGSAVVGLLAVSSAVAEVGQTGTTALRGARRSAPASGVASIRLDRAGRQLCWRIWTDDFLPQRASITLEGTVEAEKPLIFHTEIWRDGQSQGCARLGRANAQSDRRLQVDSPRYLLILTGPRAPPLTGTVVLPAGRTRPGHGHRISATASRDRSAGAALVSDEQGRRQHGRRGFGEP
jgi:Glycosyltransferase family 87